MPAAALLGLLALHNVAGNLRVPAAWYVPVNLATTAAVLGLAAAAGLSGDDIGLSVSGLPVGVGLALIVLGVLALAATRPRTRPCLADQRMAGVTRAGTAYRALVRIPLGTVVLEEVAFRGVLPALVGVPIASGLFGLWHVLPTVATLEANGVSRAKRNRVVAAAVVFTAAVGLAFCWLRTATGGLLAPALVHWAANAGATVAAFAAADKATDAAL